MTEGVARVFGEQERFDQFMADYEARVAKLDSLFKHLFDGDFS